MAVTFELLLHEAAAIEYEATPVVVPRHHNGSIHQHAAAAEWS